MPEYFGESTCKSCGKTQNALDKAGIAFNMALEKCHKCIKEDNSLIQIVDGSCAEPQSVTQESLPRKKWKHVYDLVQVLLATADEEGILDYLAVGESPLDTISAEDAAEMLFDFLAEVTSD